MKKFILLSMLSVLLIFVLIKPIFTDRRNSNLIGVKYVIKKGQSISNILNKASIDKITQDSIIFYLQKMVDIYSLSSGETIYIYKDNNLYFKKCIYEKDPMNIYEVYYENNKFIAKKQLLKKQINIAYISGTIKNNIYEFIIANNEDPILIAKLSAIFSMQLDLNERSILGRKFEIIVEKIYVNNKFISYGNIIYASVETQNRLYEVFYYKVNNSSDYYDREGNCLSGAIIKAPMTFYNRISSGFTTKRFHPIMKKYMPHMAIDYAAPRGVAVYAAADGKIINKFYDKYGGKTIIIQHENDYITEYMHLSKYNKNVIIGNYVKQGDIIGFVGKSGKTTGSHLHFAVKYKGQYINPRTMIFYPQKTLAKNEMYYFEKYTQMIYDFLFAARSINSFPVYYSKKRYILDYASIIDKSSGL